LSDNVVVMFQRKHLRPPGGRAKLASRQVLSSGIGMRDRPAGQGRSVALALLCSVAPVLEPCREAPIRGHPPTHEEWNLAVGSQTKEVRFQRWLQPGKWVVGYEPMWTPNAILIRPKPSIFDTLQVGWKDIARLERLEGDGSPWRGMAIGAAIGTAGLVTGVLICIARSEPGFGGGLGCVYIGVLSSVLIPLAAGIGASVTSPKWVPTYCSGDLE
jgi:hypothetical protein